MSYHFDFSSGNADQRHSTAKAPLKVKEGRGRRFVHFVESRITNGILEGINSKNNFINMIYFLCGKFKFDYPLYLT